MTTPAPNPNPQTRCYICGATASGAFVERDGERLWLCIDDAEKHPASTAHPPRVGESPRAAAGLITGNVRGVDEDGKQPDGAESWEYRPPRDHPDLHHDQQIIVGNTLQFQQSPPVHVNGSAPKSAPGRSHHGSRATMVEAKLDLGAVVSKMTETLSEKEREVWRRRRLLRERIPEIAEKMKMTRTAVKRALERAAGKVRKETPEW